MALPEIIEHNGKQAVSAKELHQDLGLNSAHYARWYKKCVINNQFAEEGVDYVELTKVVRSRDFALSIPFAKKLAMMTKTEKGENIRDYFLQMEKVAKKEIPAAPTPQNEDMKLLEAFQILQNRIEQKDETIKLQEKELQQSAPKVEYHDKVLQSSTSYNVSQIASELGLTAFALNQILTTNKVQYKRGGMWILYSNYQGKGYTDTKTWSGMTSDGRQKTNMQTVWTEKGRKFIHELLQEPSNAVVVSHFQKKRAS